MNHRNTFKKYQDDKQDRRKAIITSYLSKLRSSRVKFPHVTALAEMVSAYVAEQENKSCNKATLLRNKKYKALLLTFLAGHPRRGIGSVDPEGLLDEPGRVALLATQLTAGNMKREIERLTLYTNSLERQLGGQGATLGIAKADQPSEEWSKKLYESQINFARTCQALLTLVSELSQTVSLDPEHEQILNLSKLRNNVVVDTATAKPFFDWLKLNRGLAC